MSTPVGIIKKFVKTLVETKKTGTEAADAAFKAVGAVNYEVFGRKFYEARDRYPSSYQDFCEKECGIRINNTDTGAITGSDAGYSKIAKTAESIVPESAKAKELTAAQYKSFTKNGLKVNITYLDKTDTEAGENFNYSSSTYLAKQKLVVRALYNWWIPEALDLINESLGINFTDGRAATNEIDIVFYGDNKWSYYEGEALDITRISYDMGRASKVTFMINADYLYNITASDKNGTLPMNCYIYREDYYNANAFTNYLDRLILRALAEVTLKANVAYVDELPEEIAQGLCALVGGYDEATTAYYGFVNFENEAGGYGRLRYLAKQYSDGVPDGVSYNAKKTALTVSKDFEGTAIDLADFASTVKNVNASALKKAIKITGNALDNSLVGGAGNDNLLGGKGADSLSGSKGNDTLKGNAGNDVFIYTAGKDVISDYEAGDKISLSSAISKTTLSGSDVVFTIGSGTLTVKDGKGKTLTLINSKGKESTTVVSGSTSMTLTNSDKAAVTLAAEIKTANASKRTTAIKITGNDLDNTITGGAKNDSLYGGNGNDYLSGGKGNDILYGQKGNDTLWGGAGNDTLIGGDGSDVFLYVSGEGKDVISGFDKNDMLLITGEFSATYNKSKKEAYFKVGSTANAITLKDFSATTFNVNGFDYKISGKKLVISG